MNPTGLAAGGHRTVLNGVDTYYDVRGQGPLCVFLPGGPGMGASAYGDLGGVADFVTLLTLHPRGAGESGDPPDDDYSLPAHARDVAALLDHLGQEQAIVLGHSHGGMIAQRFAIDFPARVARLILSDTAANLSEFLGDVEGALARYRDRPWFPEAEAAIRREWAGEYQTAEELGQIWLAEMPFYFYDWNTEHERLRRARFGLPMRLTALRRFNEQEAPTMDLRPELGRISAPALVLVGRYDFITNLQMASDLAARIPRARLVVFDLSGHLPFFEEPEQWRSAISAFLGSDAG